jgi:6-phosphogluconolactonase (cycloisomerase 2 family)
MKKRTLICRSAVLCCAAVVFAMASGCDNDNRRVVGAAPKFLYASMCGNGTVEGYSVNPQTGALTALTGNPVASGLDCPQFMAVDPAQTHLFVPDPSAEEIHSYAISGTGTLTEAPTTVGQCVFQVAVDPSGKFLVAPDFCSDDIDVYSIGADGTLTQVTGSPFPASAGYSPQSVWIDPAGKFIYIANTTDGPSTVGVFSLSTAGALAEVTGSPFPAGNFAYAVTGTADGKYLYVNDESGAGAVLGFSVNSITGALTPLSTPSIAGGACWISAEATSKVLFSTDCSGGIFSFAIAADGNLTAAAGSPVSAGSDPYPITGDTSGSFVYAGQDINPGELFAYKYNSSGVLTAVTGIPFPTTGTDVEGIVVTH